MQVGLDDDSVVMVAEEDVAQRRARGAAGPGPSAKPQVRAGTRRRAAQWHANVLLRASAVCSL